MNTIISTNRSIQNFNGKFNLKGSTTESLRDVIDYKNFVAHNPKKDSPKLQKDLNRFFNTLKLIKNDKKEKELEVRQYCKGLPSINPLNWHIGYGDYQKVRPSSPKSFNEKNTIQYIIEIGKHAFGEKKINKPISDLEKHRLSQEIVNIADERLAEINKRISQQ